MKILNIQEITTIACLGDTLGQHFGSGFKEGAGGSFQKCTHVCATLTLCRKMLERTSSCPANTSTLNQR